AYVLSFANRIATAATTTAPLQKSSRRRHCTGDSHSCRNRLRQRDDPEVSLIPIPRTARLGIAWKERSRGIDQTSDAGQGKGFSSWRPLVMPVCIALACAMVIVIDPASHRQTMR